jgi:hypothetical protein
MLKRMQIIRRLHVSHMEMRSGAVTTGLKRTFVHSKSNDDPTALHHGFEQ